MKRRSFRRYMCLYDTIAAMTASTITLSVVIHLIARSVLPDCASAMADQSSAVSTSEETSSGMAPKGILMVGNWFDSSLGHSYFPREATPWNPRCEGPPLRGRSITPSVDLLPEVSRAAPTRWAARLASVPPTEPAGGLAGWPPCRVGGG